MIMGRGQACGFVTQISWQEGKAQCISEEIDFNQEIYNML